MINTRTTTFHVSPIYILHTHHTKDSQITIQTKDALKLAHFLLDEYNKTFPNLNVQHIEKQS